MIRARYHGRARWYRCGRLGFVVEWRGVALYGFVSVTAALIGMGVHVRCGNRTVRGGWRGGSLPGVADRPALSVVNGNADVIEALERALVQARSGELVGVVVCGIADVEGQPFSGWTWAYRDGTFAAFARLLESVSTAQEQMVRDGLD